MSAPSGSVAAESYEPKDSRPLLGIGLKVMSILVFLGMSSCIKAAGTLPAGQIVFYRSFFAIVPILAMLAWRREIGTAIRTTHPVSHVLRGLIGVTAMACSFFALTRLPLPDAVTLNYAQPLLIVAFSALFMGEAVRAYRWAAVIVGLIGVVIISWPKLTLLGGGASGFESQGLGAIAAVLGAAFSACAMLLVRKLTRTEKSATIVMWFSLTASVVALGTIPFGWEALQTRQLALLIAAGLFGGVAQILMTESYRHAEASTVAPFEYTSMIFAVIVGYLLFDDVPTLYTLVGGLIVVGAGIFIILRERRLGIERRGARAATPSAT